MVSQMLKTIKTSTMTMVFDPPALRVQHLVSAPAKSDTASEVRFHGVNIMISTCFLLKFWTNHWFLAGKKTRLILETTHLKKPSFGWVVTSDLSPTLPSSRSEKRTSSQNWWNICCKKHIIIYLAGKSVISSFDIFPSKLNKQYLQPVFPQATGHRSFLSHFAFATLSREILGTNVHPAGRPPKTYPPFRGNHRNNLFAYRL